MCVLFNQPCITTADNLSVSDTRYPRQLICEALLTLISQHPKVSRDAISAILEAGETINTSASETEQEFLIASTLSQEVFVRNACLQAMQVRVMLFVPSGLY